MEYPTNQWVADLLGISNSMASRLRSGSRRPSVRLMVNISKKLDWSVDDQAYALSYGHYAQQLEERLTKIHAESATP